MVGHAQLPETTGASRLNKSDVFYGDGTVIPDADLKSIDKVSARHSQLSNSRLMHQDLVNDGSSGQDWKMCERFGLCLLEGTEVWRA